MSPKHTVAAASTAAAPTNKNALPAKEQNLFKSVVRHYETKQLKKALKAADLILRKFPDHGETLAMKGLTLNALEKKAEATVLVRRGLRMDMKSHICWHVYGLLYRSERDYREAAKAYLNALRIDKDNQQILRDLALLQIQIRDYDGLEDTRRRLLTVRPNQRNNWIGFALSYHLLGNYQTAVSVLDTYHKTLTPSDEAEDRYETSELFLYKNMILEESGQYEEALSHLEDVSAKMIDRFAFMETRARLNAALGHFETAAAELRNLLAVNPDNQVYHHALHTCVIRHHRHDENSNGHLSPRDIVDASMTTPESYFPKPSALPSWQSPVLTRVHDLRDETELALVLDVCDQLTVSYPTSRTARRLALDIIPDATHEQFLSRADSYVRPFLRKGIPSLFSDVKPLYVNMSKAETFGRLFEAFREALEGADGDGVLPPVTTSGGKEQAAWMTDAGSSGDAGDPNSELLWVLHFLAQHYDRMGRRELALETIQMAVELSPDMVECQLTKARILKHCGDLKGAVLVTDETRNMDLSDRYLNTKCCKYALQADMVSEAEVWVGLFTRDGDTGGVQALYDMQCMWFELPAAESHLRRGQFGLALKKFTAVSRHFADMVEDQFDFHTYCLRKVTLRSYVTLLRFEDRIRKHPYYFRATTGLARCYLKLMDLSERERMQYIGEHSDIKGYVDMTDSERKKAVSKRKKQMAKRRQNQQSSSSGHKGGGKQSGVEASKGEGKEGDGGKSGGTAGAEKAKANPGWMETDPFGADLVKDLLGKSEEKENGLLKEATRVLRELNEHVGEELEAHRLCVELALRKRKLLQALRSVRRAQAIDKEHPIALFVAVRLTCALGKKGGREGFSDVVSRVYAAEGSVLGGLSVAEFLMAYEERNGGHAERRVGAALVRVWLARHGEREGGSLEEACERLCKAIDEAEGEGLGNNVLTAKMCRNVVDELRCDGVNDRLVAKVIASCCQKHERATF